MTADIEIKRRPWVLSQRKILGTREDVFLDSVSAIAVREGTDVEIRDYDYYPKDYMGPKIDVLTLTDAKKRVSPEALEDRIAGKRREIEKAESEIARLEAIRMQLYGEQTKPPTSQGGE